MLEIRNLSKSFGGSPALRDVSFSVKPSSIHGLLGHNGAGKSTTMGIILGMVSADVGEVNIGGISVLRQRSKALQKVGAIFESPAFYDYLSGWENLRLLVTYSGKFDAAAARDVVEQVDLTSRIHSKVRTYSHGMRQRLALAQALLPEPQLLLLDEPTDGLDPEGIRWFRDFILRLRDERGITVLFNSHLLAEVEQMCDHITIIKGGALVHDGTLDSLQDEGIRYVIDAEPLEMVPPLVQAFDGIMETPTRLKLPDSCDPAEVLRALILADLRVKAFTPYRRSLEDVYMELKAANP